MIDIVIGGAPKCGTSSLYAMLADHPGVLAAEPKEPRILTDTESGLTVDAEGGLVGDPALVRRAYSDLFESLSVGMRMEGTTQYLYQNVTPLALATLAPQAKIIFLLRHPARRILSTFQYSKNNLGRVRVGYTFERYVDDLLEGRKNDIQRQVNHPRSRYMLAEALERSRYATFLDHWRSHLPAERILILQQERLRDDPERVYARVLNFLGLPSHPLPQLGPRNTTYVSRWPRLNRIFKKVSPYLSGSIRAPLAGVYRRFQRNYAGEEKKKDAAGLDRLTEHYRQYSGEFTALGLEMERWWPEPQMTE